MYYAISKYELLMIFLCWKDLRQHTVVKNSFLKIAKLCNDTQHLRMCTSFLFGKQSDENIIDATSKMRIRKHFTNVLVQLTAEHQVGPRYEWPCFECARRTYSRTNVRIQCRTGHWMVSVANLLVCFFRIRYIRVLWTWNKEHTHLLSACPINPSWCVRSWFHFVIAIAHWPAHTPAKPLTLNYSQLMKSILDK